METNKNVQNAKIFKMLTAIIMKKLSRNPKPTNGMAFTRRTEMREFVD